MMLVQGHAASKTTVRVAVFAYNEQRHIAHAIDRLLEEGRAFEDYCIHVLVNGSTDKTYEIVQAYAELNPGRISVHRYEKGDKAETWNRYAYDIAPSVVEDSVHFFMDGDVWPEPGSIESMAKALTQRPELTAVAGLPFTGRNRARYTKLAKEKHLLYGNLYATRGGWLAWAREVGFRIPLGLIAEDCVVANALTTCQDDLRRSRLSQIGHVDGCGYRFYSLQPWRFSDIGLYIRRLTRYRLAKAQLNQLGWLWPDQQPLTIDQVNMQLLRRLKSIKIKRHPLDHLVLRRLEKQYG